MLSIGNLNELLHLISCAWFGAKIKKPIGLSFCPAQVPTHIVAWNVILPGDVPLREFPQNAVVEVVTPEIGSGARERFGGADAFWWTKAEDIVAKKGAQPSPPQSPTPGSKQTGDAPK